MTDSRQPLRDAFAAKPRRTWAWMLPLLAALVLVAVFITWLEFSERQDREEARATLISDALSVEQQLRARLQGDRDHLNELARWIGDDTLTADTFGRAPAVTSWLRQRWLSLVWTDAAERIVLSLPDASPLTLSREPERRGLSSHLVAAIPASASHSAGRLVARFSLTALLDEGVPWWHDRRYVATLVNDDDETIATTAQPGELAAGDAHRIGFEMLPGVSLELRQRAQHVPWYRTYPLGLVGLVLALLGWSTWLLRDQFRGVERAEAAWRTEAGWRRAMEDALTIGLRARDLEGRLIYANARFHELTGYAPAELLGHAPPMPYWPPDAIDATFDRFRRTIGGDAPREGYESRWQRKDGTPIDVMVFEAPLLDARGTQVGWMGTVINVTERNRAAERERQAAERLAHLARLTSLGEIASSLAHQLNQPLMAIASYNAGLRNALQSLPGVDARLLSALDRQAEQAAHAGRIVHRIRDFLLRRAPQLEPGDLNRIVADSASLLLASLQRQNIALEVELSPAALPVQADAVLLGQVLVNLVRNAADAIVASDAERCIVIRTQASGRSAQFEVIDRGPGLGGKRLDELAAPFYSTKADGMGLGLAICRSVIEAHGGALDAIDASAGGACFRVTLPRLEVEHAG